VGSINRFSKAGRTVLRFALATMILLLVPLSRADRWEGPVLPDSGERGKTALAKEKGPHAYAVVDGPCDLRFPSDHGAHLEYRVEWWYYTGNLKTLQDKVYGFQLTFFRIGIGEPGSDANGPAHPSAWRTSQLYCAHAALSDMEGKRFFFEEQMMRGALGLAGVSPENGAFRVHVRDWSAAITEKEHRLHALTDRFGLELTCRPEKPPVAHGIRGYSRKGLTAERASCYYSFSRLRASGVMVVGGRRVPVTGLAWMDHEYSTAPLERGITGWDWFGLQFQDETEWMFFVLRREQGGYHPASSGTHVSRSGQGKSLSSGDFHVTILDRWKSPHTGAVYPSKWRILVPPENTELMVTSRLEDQELRTATLGVTYWEGSVAATANKGGRPVQGVGYVEMTGYASPFTLLQ